MKHKYLILIILFFSISTFGQDAYFVIDSTTFIGIKLIDHGDIQNSRFLQVIKDKNVIKYAPYEVKEFGFKNGKVYKSFEIEIDNTMTQYFLERLVDGDVKLYYLRAKRGVKKYYLAKNDTLRPIEIPSLKEKYKILIKSITEDCPNTTQSISYIKIKKHNLIRFFQDFNNCVKNPFPRFRYGVAFALNANTFSSIDNESIYSVPNYRNNLSLSVNAFADIPIRFNNFSFNPEISYNRISTGEAFDYSDISNDLVINYSSISFSSLFRYTIFKKKFSLYFLLGPSYSHCIENESILYEYEANGSDIFMNIVSSQILNDLIGGSIGFGLIPNYGSKFSWFSELRYSRFYNLDKEYNSLNLSKISLKFGLLL